MVHISTTYLSLLCNPNSEFCLLFVIKKPIESTEHASAVRKLHLHCLTRDARTSLPPQFFFSRSLGSFNAVTLQGV